MAKKSAKGKVGASAAALEPRGKKIVFDEEPSVDVDDSENDQQSVTGDEDELENSEDVNSEQESTDSDDDDAPEAVGFAVDQRKARAEAEAEEARRKAKIERQKQLQSQKEAEKKAKASKAAEALLGKASKSAKGKKVVQEDSEEESVTGSDGESAEDDDAEFHTASEDDLDADLDEDLDEASDEDAEDEDDEETLKYDESDPQVKRLQARMQKAMEAAERRATEDDTPSTKKSKSGKTETPAEVAEPVEERSEYDMGPVPLPQSVLRVAAEVDLMRKKAEKRKAEVASSSKSKKRKRRMQRDEDDLTTRALNSRTAIQLLPSADSMSCLPPVVAPRAQVSQKTNLDGFRKRAMKRSGLALGTKANSRKPTSLALAQGSGVPAPRFDR